MNYNYNYAKIVNNELVFAPMVQLKNNVYSINAVSDYLADGYKKVYGDNLPLCADNQNVYTTYHEFDDYIVVIREPFSPDWWWGRYINSNKITNFKYYFQNYTEEEFKSSIPYGIDTSNGINFNYMFKNSLITTIPTLDLRKAETANSMFYGCTNLITIEKIICNSLKISTFGYEPFYNCSNLSNITFEGTIKVDSNLYFSYCEKLTVDSIINIFNALEDNTGETTQFTIYLSNSLRGKLTEEQINIATNKNINISWRDD